MGEPKGAHLVGSICLDTTEEVFTTVSKELSKYLRFIPDGETGDRSHWIMWQGSVFKHAPRLQRCIDSGLEPEDEPSVPMSKVPEMLGKLQPGYAALALDSYKMFKKMKSEGQIPAHIKFQVAFPTPLAGIVRGVDPSYALAAEPSYEEAIYREMREVQDAIPHSELAIQWDVANEVMFLEGAYLKPEQMPPEHRKIGYAGPYFDNVRQETLDRLVRYGSKTHVDEDVEMGYHLCYGDFHHKHFKDPVDLGLLADVIEDLLSRVDRRINWVHLPVPREKTQEAYYTPLKRVTPTLKEKDTKLFVGLVHGFDLDGTKKRVAVASEILGSDVNWGVATECGIGRTPREELPSIFDIIKEVSQPIS